MTLTSTLRDRLLPKTVVSRMTAVLFLGILVAQVLGTLIWIEQLKTSERNRLIEVSQNMGSRIGQTIDFFGQLPDKYRHIVLDQLRDMGGTRFFVSVNKQFIELNQIVETEFAELVRDNLKASMFAQLGAHDTLDIQFVQFDDLKILSGTNRMVDLPPKWKRFALLEPKDSSPVAVVQLPAGDEWIYLAAVIPEGSLLMGIPWFTTERLISIGLVSLTVLILTVLLIRWIVMPLKLLAQQAEALGKGRTPRFLMERGSTEMMATIRAFNAMATRINKFIADRDSLFASISHDLKTPLTRARLRAEMIKDESKRNALIGDLDNLETMVKGSLQMMKEGAIHENTETVDLRLLLLHCINKAKVVGLPASLNIPQDLRLEGRPMALDRLFTNLIDNALSYGNEVEVRGEKSGDEIRIYIMDRGEGLSDEQKERVFEPYYRIDKESTKAHVGLGMSIARSLANLHGGDLDLTDRPGGGLVVEVHFPL
ncbi:MAG: hypothetical protein CL393_09755 [Acidiferrobacteraceae bacterium]|nr:hypothetical protein [Acidiferrobacteraceae bacterium]